MLKQKQGVKRKFLKIFLPQHTYSWKTRYQAYKKYTKRQTIYQEYLYRYIFLNYGKF